MRSAEITPTSQKIDKLIKRIGEGDIKIPAFQRGFVWKQLACARTVTGQKLAQ